MTQCSDKSYMRRPVQNPWLHWKDVDDRPLVRKLAQSKWRSPLPLHKLLSQIVTPEAKLRQFWEWFSASTERQNIEAVFARAPGPLPLLPFLIRSHQRYVAQTKTPHPVHWDKAPELHDTLQRTTQKIWDAFHQVRKDSLGSDSLVFDLFLDGLTAEEISTLLSLDIEDVHNQISNSKQELQSELQRKWAVG